MTGLHGSTRIAAQKHSCGAASCRTTISRETFLCGTHSDMLVPSLRHAVRDSYQPGQTPLANRYLAAAVDAIAHKERRTIPPRERPKAIQLALFDL